MGAPDGLLVLAGRHRLPARGGTAAPQPGGRAEEAEGRHEGFPRADLLEAERGQDEARCR